jgi:hypothetical protein
MVKQELVDATRIGVSEYLSKKKDRITEEYSIKDVLFRNWIFSLLMTNVMFEYLVSGDGNIADFYERNKISLEESLIHIDQLKRKIFPIGKTSCGLFAPQAIQHAFENYEKDPGYILYNLFFCLIIKDHYLANLFSANYNKIFLPSTYTRNEAYDILDGIYRRHNKFVGKVFYHFEMNEGVPHNEIRKGNRIRLFQNAFDSRITMENGMFLKGTLLPDGKYEGKLVFLEDLKREEGIFDENGDLIEGSITLHGYTERGQFKNGVLFKGTKKNSLRRYSIRKGGSKVNR